MKVQLTLDDELMQRVDNYADRNYMSRSGLVSFALSQFLNADDFRCAMIDFTVSLRKMSDKAMLDHEDLEKLEDMERFVAMLSQKSK